MKEYILLEQFILSRQATNDEHRKALEWLGTIQRKNNELQAKVDDNQKP